MLRWLLAAALISAAFGQSGGVPRKWALQYFYDQDGKDLHITDLAFPSATRGVAVGAIVDRDGRRPQFTALVTSDGGQHWSLVPLKEFPRSLFFLDESNGWLVTDEGRVVHKREAGPVGRASAIRSSPSKKLADAPHGGLILRVWFLDAQHGFAAGFQKSVFETHDGGRTWKPVEEAAKPSANPAFSVYSHIAFADAGRGVIFGAYIPPRGVVKERDQLPDWMVPERALAPPPTAAARHRIGHARRRRNLEFQHGSAARLSGQPALGRRERVGGVRIRGFV